MLSFPIFDFFTISSTTKILYVSLFDWISLVHYLLHVVFFGDESAAGQNYDKIPFIFCQILNFNFCIELNHCAFYSGHYFYCLSVEASYFGHVGVRLDPDSSLYNRNMFVLFFFPLTSTGSNKNSIEAGALGKVSSFGLIINSPLECRCTY